MILLPGMVNFDLRILICGTQSALASFSERLPQAHKSKIKNQKSALVHLLGGDA